MMEMTFSVGSVRPGASHTQETGCHLLNSCPCLNVFRMDAQKVNEILIKVFFIEGALYFRSMAFLHALL